MADALKVLGQLAAAATTDETLYTVPDVTQTTCSSLVVCNRGSSQLTFRVRVGVAGASADNKQYLFYDTPIDGNSTMTMVIGITLNQTDIVATYASATGLSFTLFGVETS